MEHQQNYSHIKTEYPDCTIFESVEQVAEEIPHNTALVYMNMRITYKEMIKRIKAVQRGLVLSGVKKGDKVMVCLPDVPQAVYLLYAINRMGAVGCFVHPLSSDKELCEYLRLTDCKSVVILDSCYKTRDSKEMFYGRKVIVTSLWDELPLAKGLPDYLSLSVRVHTLSHKVYSWKRLMRGGSETLPEKVAMSCYAPAVVLFSGGTTGKQKGVMISSYSLNAAGVQTGLVCGCSTQGRVMLTVLPLFHGFGLGVCVHAMLINKGTCVLLPRFSAASFVKSIKKHRPDFLAGVPTMYEAILRNKCLREPDLSCLRGVFCGGDTLTEKLRRKFDGYLKERGATVKIREGYGLTECVAVSCLTPEDNCRQGSVGIPLPDMNFKICKADTIQELPLGTEGEICISGPTLMLGYLKDKAETHRAIRRHKDGRLWLHTGDAGVMDAEGFVYLRQRIKRIIVTSGYNVYPSQIEQLLNAHPAVEKSCVVGVKDNVKMQRVKAFVVLAEGFSAGAETASELYDYCRRSLPRYAPVSEIEFTASLPATPYGKVDYRKIENTGQVP